MSGAENAFCLRYQIVNSTIQACNPFHYFSRYFVEPFSVCFFTALNTLSQNLRRSMYHQPESQVSKWSFCLPLFSMESFWYLVYRMGVHGIGISCEHKQCVVKYFNTLWMQCHTKQNRLSYLQILSQPALDALRRFLGLGAGLGLAKKRPTKAAPEGYCSIGAILTSVECEREAPYEVLLNPDCHCTADGIDIIYLEQNRYLTCTVRFTKVVVREAADATKRIAVAQVRKAPESGVYLNVWFHYNGSLLETLEINNEEVTCSYADETSQNIILPLNVVAELVAQFGSN
jgi:hypothetical protein